LVADAAPRQGAGCWRVGSGWGATLALVADAAAAQGDGSGGLV